MNYGFSSVALSTRKRFKSRLCFVAQPTLESTGPADFQNLIRSAVNGGCTSIQLRGKNLSTRKFVEAAQLARQVLESFPASLGVPLIINDRVDVALAVNADGVHLGREDLSAATARRLLGTSKIVGVTVSSPAQAKQALFDGADYLGTDAIFNTPTKPESNVLGLESFSRICASTSLPVLGIGGVNSSNAIDVLRAGAHGIAVVSAISSAANPESAAASLNQIIQQETQFDSTWSLKVASLWESLKLKQPMIQHLTNYVVMNSTANVTLATGARPVMSHETDLIPHAGSVLLNIGTLDEEWIRRFDAASEAANAANIPLILDPVGAGATQLRTNTATNLLRRFKFACVKGNAGEMGVLARDDSARVRGVDSDYQPSSPSDIVARIAKSFNTVAAMTGKIDFVSDGVQVIEVHNNSALLADVTGTGCAASTVVSAMLAASNPRDSCLGAVVAGLACFAIAAEKAEERHLRSSERTQTGPASFWNGLIDELYRLSAEDIIARSCIRSRRVDQ